VLLTILIALILVGTSAAMLARALAVGRTRAVRHLGQIHAYGYTATGVDGDKRPARTVLDDFAGAIGASLATRFGGMREVELRKQLIAAGLYKTPPRRFLGYMALSAVVLPVSITWLTIAAGAAGALLIVLVAVMAPLGWMLPRIVVRRMATRRFERIDYELPELIDLLVVTVEAGLGFSASLRMAATRIEGPLGDELRLTIQEHNMGLAINDALKNFLERCDTPSVRGFVRSVVQGERLGVSMGQIMRNLALEMRKRRRQLAEERAHKAPVKLLFPLIFLIFPALFVVILGPAMFTLMKAFE
jgi:tight adherence protein C